MKKYIVVGGTSGIGAEIVSLLSQNNENQVIVISRKTKEDFGNVSYYSADILNEELPDFKDLEFLNGLVYCPGSITLKPINSLKEEDFLNDFHINVLGAVKAIKRYLPLLKKGENGNLVLFSTVAVQTGMPFHASIATAKGGVEALTRSLSAELAPKVRVNCIAPSLTDTPMAAMLLSNDTKRENALKRHPMQSVGEPKDIASVAEFLLSDNAKWMTGQVIHIDGGIGNLKV
jgi:NAD(P)-dependent dehydrogenase (short-subunit alcohol dehydrogenase family)